ncbi:MAG TPA: hypothetical protein VGB54_13510 [Allosphingosinicella sp.]|jgi:hypothetical protein
MKTISFALVSAGLLALTACGGGTKGNSSTNTTNSLASDPLANSSTYETELGGNGLGTSNGTLGTTNSTGTGTNLSGNVSTTTTTTNTSTTNSH